jgi:hypothetical protein
MTSIKSTALIAFGLALLSCAGLSADEWNQKTLITFSGPVEIPGQVLEPGTYVFKLADSQSGRNIVQVFSKDETHLYGTFLAIPDERLRPAGKAIITFDERPAGSPEALRAWFYPGETYGHEFVYQNKPRRHPATSRPGTLLPGSERLAALVDGAGKRSAARRATVNAVPSIPRISGGIESVAQDDPETRR